MIGRVVDVSANLDTISVHHDGVLIAAHGRKWARHLTVTDPAHVARAAELRTQFQAQRARRPVPTAAVETASLARYDDLFCVDFETAPDNPTVASCSGRKRPRRSSTTPAPCEHHASAKRSAA